MKTSSFENLIGAITGRDLYIDTKDQEIVNNKEYIVFRTLPLTKRRICFKWKTSVNDEKLLRSFITSFCNKYKEPNPVAYDWFAKTYGNKYKWVNKTDLEKEYAYMHHSSNMFSKKELMKQIESNFSNPEVESTLLKHGFYATEYGIGIFAFWQTQYVTNAIEKMKDYLTKESIPFKNEFSDARWVYRFKINTTKEIHNNLLNNFK